MQDSFARARTRPSARATIGYLVYKLHYYSIKNLSTLGQARTDRVWSTMSTLREPALYTRYPIVARRAWPTGCIGRVCRANKGILHTRASPLVDTSSVNNRVFCIKHPRHFRTRHRRTSILRRLTEFKCEPLRFVASC